MRRFIAWFASFFNESSPNSFSRFITFIIVSFILGWHTSLMHYERKLDGATFVMMMGAAATFYGIRRLAGAYTDSKVGAQQPGATNDGNGTQPNQQ